MELFYSGDIASGICTLTGDEAAHCVRVLRHKEGDTINVIDGAGTMYSCVMDSCSPKCVSARIVEVNDRFGAHNYRLTMAVAPPKNIERFEWFVEKATEIGLDHIYPVIGDFSERRTLRTERLERIVLSACKQSLKAALPLVHQPSSVLDFIKGFKGEGVVKAICYCDSIEGASKALLTDIIRGHHDCAVLIGPEGDFSPREVEAAIAAGWQTASLGNSRLRIETAALTAVGVTYFLN